MPVLVNLAQAVALNARADQPRENRCNQQRGPEPEPAADLESEKCAEHVEARMREVEHAEHAENNCQAAGHQKQQHAEQHAVKRGYDDQFKHDPSTPPGYIKVTFTPAGAGVNAVVCDLLRAGHLAGGWQHGLGGVDLGGTLPAPAGLFLVERLLVVQFAELRDVHRLEELVVVLAHDAVAAVEDVVLHVFQGRSDLHRLDRLGLFSREREHAHLVDGARIEQAEAVLRAQRLFKSHRRVVLDVGVAFGDLEDLIVEVALLDRGRAAGAACIVGVPVDLQTGVRCGLEQQGEVLAPVAGDDAVRARRLDLCDVGREVLDLQQRMLFVTDDLDVGTLGLEHREGRCADRFAERVVLIDQVDLLHRRLGLHVVGQRFHLDVGIRIPAEVPVAALVVREARIDRGIVEEQHFLAGVAFVVLVDEVDQRARHRRTVALGEVANAGVDRLLGLDQAFLRVDLVIERHDLDLLAADAALGVHFVGQILKRLEADFADAGAAAGQRIDVGDFQCILRDSSSAERKRKSRSQH